MIYRRLKRQRWTYVKERDFGIEVRVWNFLKPGQAFKIIEGDKPVYLVHPADVDKLPYSTVLIRVRNHFNARRGFVYP